MTVAGNASGNAALLANATTVIAFSPDDDQAVPEEAGPWVSHPGCGISGRF